MSETNAHWGIVQTKIGVSASLAVSVSSVTKRSVLLQLRRQTLVKSLYAVCLTYMLPPQSLWEPGGYCWGLLRPACGRPRERSLVVAQDALKPFRGMTSNHLDVR